MDQFARFWRGGGAWMYPLLLLALLGLALTLVLGILALVSRQGSRRALILSTVLGAYGLLVLGTGFLGWEMSNAKIEGAVAHVNPADRAMILAEGRAEARAVVVFGAASALPPLLVGIALLGLGIARLPRSAGPVVDALPRR